MAALDGLGAWSNLGRNVVFVGPDLRPRAAFEESVFTDDEASQYDLDVHAILDVPGVGLVLTLNHYGMVRAFDGDQVAALGRTLRVTPITQDFAADVERYVIVGERLVGSRPREHHRPGRRYRNLDAATGWPAGSSLRPRSNPGDGQRTRVTGRRIRRRGR